MKTIHLKIDGRDVTAQPGETILEAAKHAGIHIPTLCFLKGIANSGSCRVCLVEVEKARTLLSACTTPVSQGMVVYTHSARVLKGRRSSVELLISNHTMDCLHCIRNQNCELQQLAFSLGIRQSRFTGMHTEPTFDDASEGIVRDTGKCILCQRCIETCRKVQGLGILDLEKRGFNTVVGPVFNQSMHDVNCMQCGQCVINCPLGALSEKENIHDVLRALQDTEKTVIVQTAPAVRASLGEEFGMPIGTRVTGRMVAALRRCGFDRVYDTDFGADLTIMEEGNELLQRLRHNGVLPMFTSCSPGWVRYVEFEYPELIPHLSTSKSPHMMFGSIVKSYWAKQKKIPAEKIYVVSIMPCTAKKAEIIRPENKTSMYEDVDAVLTTREAARLIRLFGIDFTTLPDEPFDQDLLGDYTGAGVIFGASGGVMEAALRTVKQKLENVKLEKVDFHECRGLKGVKEAEIDLAGKKMQIAITSGMQAAKPLLEEVKKGTSRYTFIEVMGCPGGCINGGGQSIIPSRIKNDDAQGDYRKKRMQALYDEDVECSLRISSDNPQIQKLYADFLHEPGSEKAEELLHTSYSSKARFHKM